MRTWEELEGEDGEQVESHNPGADDRNTGPHPHALDAEVERLRHSLTQGDARVELVGDGPAACAQSMSFFGGFSCWCVQRSE